MTAAVVVVALGLAVLALDQAALWAERRGWIHWRRTGRGSAALGAFDVYQPETRHVREWHDAQEVLRDDDAEGAPPRPVDDEDRRDHPRR